MNTWFSFTRKGQKSDTASVSPRIQLRPHMRSLYRQEIAHWQSARALRFRVQHPRTQPIQELYMDAMLDNHLSAVINNRILRIQNKHFVVRGKDHQVHDEKSRWIATSWFRELLRYLLEAVFYGYSLIWIKDFHEDGRFKELALLDRRYVLPEQGQLLSDLKGDKGLLYGNYPHHLLLACSEDRIGLLEKAAPLTILKRHSWANWDEFEQVFGLPMRIARVPSLESADTEHIVQWLEQMGTAAYAVLPSSTEVEITESRRTDAYSVFQEKIKTVNAELSRLINGQTMTVESGSSRSQSEVHERTEAQITRADLVYCTRWLNEHLLPAMRFHGYALDTDDTFSVLEELRMEERMRIDEVLLKSGVPLSKAYLEDTYQVKIADKDA